MQATYLKINPADSVVVCLSPKKKGEIIDVDGRQITINQDTPAGHKVLIKDVTKGEDIIRHDLFSSVIINMCQKKNKESIV